MKKEYWLLACVTIIAFALRLWSSFTISIEVDEPVNYWVSLSTLSDYIPTMKPQFGEVATPYAFHPPFYYQLGGLWLQAFGNSILSLRIMSVIFSTLSIYLIGWWLIRRGHEIPAMIFTILIAVEPWTVITTSMAYIESTQLLLIAIAIVAYSESVSGEEKPTSYVLSGLAVACVVIYKHIGIFLLIGIGIHYLLFRKHHRGHISMGLTALAVIAVYCGVMYFVYREWWYLQSLTHVQRIFGMRESRGLNMDIGTVITMIITKYWLFVTTISLMVVGGFLTAVRILSILRNSFVVINSTERIVLSWAMGSIVFAVGVQLKSPHYYMLWIIPLVLVVSFFLSRIQYPLNWTSQAAVSLLGAFGLLALTVRITFPFGDTLADAARFINENIPAESLVVTETYIGALIEQPYIRIDKINERNFESSGAKYFAVYSSTTAKVPRNAEEFVSRCKFIGHFQGFKDQIDLCVIDTPDAIARVK